jgi:excisionase family DNA binding protein
MNGREIENAQHDETLRRGIMRGVRRYLETLLTAGELAARLGVSASTVRRWRALGRIQAVRIGAGAHRYDETTTRPCDAENEKSPAGRGIAGLGVGREGENKMEAITVEMNCQFESALAAVVETRRKFDRGECDEAELRRAMARGFVAACPDIPPSAVLTSVRDLGPAGIEGRRATR